MVTGQSFRTSLRERLTFPEIKSSRGNDPLRSRLGITIDLTTTFRDWTFQGAPTVFEVTAMT